MICEEPFCDCFLSSTFKIFASFVHKHSPPHALSLLSTNAHPQSHADTHSCLHYRCCCCRVKCAILTNLWFSSSNNSSSNNSSSNNSSRALYPWYQITHECA